MEGSLRLCVDRCTPGQTGWPCSPPPRAPHPALPWPVHAGRPVHSPASGHTCSLGPRIRAACLQLSTASVEGSCTCKEGGGARGSTEVMGGYSSSGGSGEHSGERRGRTAVSLWEPAVPGLECRQA